MTLAFRLALGLVGNVSRVGGKSECKRLLRPEAILRENSI
jgi:hypothetical protein